MDSGEQPDCFTIAVQRSDIDVSLAVTYGAHFVAAGNVGVYQRAEVLILLAPDTPQIVKFRKRGTGKL